MSSPDKNTSGKDDREQQTAAPGDLSARLIANLTHELKTPLHSILAVGSLLSNESDGPLNTEQKRQVDMILRNAGVLLELIQDLLQYSSAGSGNRPLIIEKVNVSRLVENTLIALQAVADKSEINLVSDISELPEAFFTDKVLLRQIIANLLGNAIKFSSSGGEVSIYGKLTKNSELFLQIVDNGIGITPEVQNVIFKDFFQVDSGDARRYGGVGLGLALVKKSVDLLCGRIDLKSEKGKGSLFTVYIPDSSAELQKSLIGIIDEDNGIRLSLEECFRTEGYSCKTYDNDKQLFEQLAEDSPDLLLLSCNKDNSVLIQLRKYEWSCNTPIIVMSTKGNPDERAQAFRAGASDFILKPFDIDEVRVRVKSQLIRANES